MTDIFTNSVVLKVHGGTVRSDENLCSTCRNCQVTRGARTGNEVYRCNANYNTPVTLREGAASCSAYDDKRRPSLQQMTEIAWSLMTDKGGRKIGFLSPEELRERSQESNTPLTPRVGF